MLDKVAEKLNSIAGVELTRPDPVEGGCHIDAVVPMDAIRDAALALRNLEFLIESVTAVDATPTMIVYHLVRVDQPLRVVLRVLMERDKPECPTIEDIYPGANWHERETHDFFGIEFTNHPDMTMLILPEDAVDLKPLLKDEKKLKELGDVIPRFAKPAEPEEGKKADDSEVAK